MESRYESYELTSSEASTDACQGNFPAATREYGRGPGTLSPAAVKTLSPAASISPRRFRSEEWAVPDSDDWLLSLFQECTNSNHGTCIHEVVSPSNLGCYLLEAGKFHPQFPCQPRTHWFQAIASWSVVLATESVQRRPFVCIAGRWRCITGPAIMSGRILTKCQHAYRTAFSSKDMPLPIRWCIDSDAQSHHSLPQAVVPFG